MSEPNDKVHSYRDVSRANWGAIIPNGTLPTGEQLQLGAILRIADATERMATNYTQLQADLDRYKRQLEAEKSRSMKLLHSIRGYKSRITELKKQLEAKEVVNT